MTVHVIDSGVVCAGCEDTDHQSCAFPQVCVLPNGRWLCGFRVAPTKQAVAGQRSRLTWSDDEGKTWSKPIEPFTAITVEGRAGLFRAVGVTPMGGSRVLAVLYWVDASDPSRPFFNEQTEGLLDSRICLSQSSDGGQTWSAPERIDTTPFNIPTPITGPILRLSSGELAVQFELNKHYDDTSEWRHKSVLMFSSDGGRSWPAHTLASDDPTNRIFYWDQRPAVMPDGRILDVFWTYDRQTAVYLNIHARESRDHGRTWSAMWDTGVPGQPAAPVALSGNRIGLVYVDRTGSPVIKMRVSGDGGRTFPESTEAIVYQTDTASQTWAKKSMQDAWAEMGKFSIGLPATAVLPNGDTLVVFYAGRHTDLTDVRWARLDPSA